MTPYCHPQEVATDALSGVELLEQNLPFSSCESSSEGAPQAAGLLRSGTSSSSSLAEQPVVSVATGDVRVESPVPGPSSVADGPRSVYLRLLLSNPAPSYLAFLTEVRGSQFGPENVALLTLYLHPSTLNQYQSVWSSWLSFVRDNRPRLINADFLISYLRFLFCQCQFSPNTIKTYKAAL